MPKHLPNLDTLRFIAAATVVAYHVDSALTMNGFKSEPINIFPFGFGGLAVVFFFVLSGFLITYLLLQEKQKGSISTKNFYIKRILRIWPLYYLVVAASFFYFNQHSLFVWHGVTDNITVGKHPILNTLLLLLICPNLVLVSSTAIGYANPTWSIGIEEQFYLLWPWIIKSKNPLKVILIMILVVYLLNNGLLALVASAISTQSFIPFSSSITKMLYAASHFFTFPYSFRIDAMAIGALGGYAVAQRSSLLKVVYTKSFQIALYLIAIPLLLFSGMVNYQFYSVIFLLIIINMATNPATIFNIGNRITDYFGRISYGIYLFHSMAIMPLIFLVTRYWKLPVNFISELLILLLTLGVTIAFAALSFHTYERFFLSLKKRIEHPTAIEQHPVITVIVNEQIDYQKC